MSNYKPNPVEADRITATTDFLLQRMPPENWERFFEIANNYPQVPANATEDVPIVSEEDEERILELMYPGNIEAYIEGNYTEELIGYSMLARYKGVDLPMPSMADLRTVYFQAPYGKRLQALRDAAWQQVKAAHRQKVFSDDYN